MTEDRVGNPEYKISTPNHKGQQQSQFQVGLVVLYCIGADDCPHERYNDAGERACWTSEASVLYKIPSPVIPFGLTQQLKSAYIP